MNEKDRSMGNTIKHLQKKEPDHLFKILWKNSWQPRIYAKLNYHVKTNKITK